jgi:hypothetical protein
MKSNNFLANNEAFNKSRTNAKTKNQKPMKYWTKENAMRVGAG